MPLFAVIFTVIVWSGVVVLIVPVKGISLSEVQKFLFTWSWRVVSVVIVKLVGHSVA